MALGYEGYVQIGGVYALGTGTAVPRVRQRLDSQSAYGGREVTPVASIGIGAPHDYDWTEYNGSLNFEVTSDIFNLLSGWVYSRNDSKGIVFSSRKGNVQSFSESYFSSITVTASEGSFVDGTLDIVAMSQSYAYGDSTVSGYFNNKQGVGLLCSGSGFPTPLNVPRGCNPIPYWNTKVTLGGQVMDCTTWTMTFSQDIVKIFACNNAVSAQPPAYLGVSPMTVTLSGSWMWLQNNKPSSFPPDVISSANVDVAGSVFNFGSGELQSISDNVQTGDSTTPVEFEYSMYALA